jgi:hypothetical protein
VTITDSTVGPGIDATAFPNTPAAAFWTATPYVPAAGSAWLVGAGLTAFGAVTVTARVRCVREGA